jgi:transposase
MARRYFSEAFKRAVLASVVDGETSMSAVARQHGLDPSLVRRWKAQLGYTLPLPAELEAAAVTTAAELSALRREVTALRTEREILKKAAAFFEEHGP